MNRRGFLRLLSGGAAFRALGLPTAKVEQSIFGSGSDGDLVLSGDMTLPKRLHKAYEIIDFGGRTWMVNIRDAPVSRQ